MSADEEVHVDNIENFRLFTVNDDPNYMVLRIETRDGRAFNSGSPASIFRTWLRCGTRTSARSTQLSPTGNRSPKPRSLSHEEQIHQRAS